MKTCFKCGETKPLSEFYKHAQMKDGYLNKCKCCAKIDGLANLKLRMEDPEFVLSERKRARAKSKLRRSEGKAKPYNYVANGRWRQRNPEKYRAHNMAQRIPMQPCEVCGTTENVERHHDDYSKPMEVRFLCIKHHNKHHVKQREEQLLCS